MWLRNGSTGEGKMARPALDNTVMHIRVAQISGQLVTSINLPAFKAAIFSYAVSFYKQ
jgi:hypothetical protein